MIESGILNPAIASLLRRVRHTNTFAIADRGFPSWPGIESIDISLVDNVPTVLQVLSAVIPGYKIGAAWMADEFRSENSATVCRAFEDALAPTSIQGLPHAEFKRRIPGCVGIIRTGDTTQYANIIVESA